MGKKPNLQAPKYDPASLKKRGEGRASQLPRRLGVSAEALRNATLLEFGCGNGEVTIACRSMLNANGIGVDIVPRWKSSLPEEMHGLFHEVDLTTESPPFGPVDFIHSYTVFEHVERPLEAIKALHSLLKPGGRAYLNFNLYRGASASHLRAYLDFPWVHLVCSEDEIRAMMREKHGIDRGPAWVNKMTYAQYLRHFESSGFVVDRHWFDRYPMDDEFYERYEEKLRPYPRYELELNFMHVRLIKK